MTATPTTMQWIRDAAQRLSRGSGRLTLLIARRITRRGADRLRAWGSGTQQWLAAASGFDWLLRVACLVAVGLVAREALLAVASGLAGRADAVAGPLLGWASLVWVVVAYRIGRKDWRPRSEQPAEPTATIEPTPTPTIEQPADDQDDAEPIERPLPTREQLAESLARVGTPHAHIAALADDLGTTAECVRAALDRHGVPVAPVRMRGRGSSTGIKGGSLPAPATPLGSVVAAGQDANNDNNNARPFVITDDPDNPYQHYVHYAKG